MGLVISGQMELWWGIRHLLLHAGDSRILARAASLPQPRSGDMVVVWAISPRPTDRPTY